MVYFKQVAKLYLCVFFCNNTQKNMKDTDILKVSARYICKPDFWSMNQPFGKSKVKKSMLYGTNYRSDTTFL